MYDDDDDNTGVIVGSVIGATLSVAAIAAIVAGIIFLLGCLRRTYTDDQPEAVPVCDIGDNMTVMEMNPISQDAGIVAENALSEV